MDQGDKSFLPHCYNPSSLDVICGRGVEYFNHSGNKNFRQTISNHLDRYTSAKTKFEKSSIVIEVANEARLNNGQPCRFVRWCYEQQRWYEITGDALRQKVGQTLRESLLQRDPQKRAVKNSKRAMNKAIRLGKIQNANFSQMTPSVPSFLAANPGNAGETERYHVHSSEIQSQQTSMGMLSFHQLQIASSLVPFSLMMPSNIPSREGPTQSLSNADQNCLLHSGHVKSNTAEQDKVQSKNIQNQQNSTDRFSFPQVQIGSNEMSFSLMLPSTTSIIDNAGYRCIPGQSCLPMGLMSVLKNEDDNSGFQDEDSDESDLSSVGWFEDDNFVQDMEHS